MKQLFHCFAQTERGPVQCAWFDAQTRYASVEMSAEEGAHACERQQTDENATTDGVSVCTRTVTADHSVASHASSPECSNVSIETMTSERELSPHMCTVATDDLLRWASDPMLSDTSSEWSWSQQDFFAFAGARWSVLLTGHEWTHLRARAACALRTRET